MTVEQAEQLADAISSVGRTRRLPAVGRTRLAGTCAGRIGARSLSAAQRSPAGWPAAQRAIPGRYAARVDAPFLFRGLTSLEATVGRVARSGRGAVSAAGIEVRRRGICCCNCWPSRASDGDLVAFPELIVQRSSDRCNRRRRSVWAAAAKQGLRTGQRCSRDCSMHCPIPRSLRSIVDLANFVTREQLTDEHPATCRKEQMAALLGR